MEVFDYRALAARQEIRLSQWRKANPSTKRVTIEVPLVKGKNDAQTCRIEWEIREINLKTGTSKRVVDVTPDIAARSEEQNV